MADFLTSLDESLASLFTGWNTLSTILALSITAYVVYLITSAQDPDIHPMLLQRQATASQVRKQGESAVYRAADTPHGFPLRSGLNVKDKGAPAYASGRDGDLRDVWRRVTGEVPLEPVQQGYGAAAREQTPAVGQGKIMTVYGREVVEHSIPEITKEIAILGSYFKKTGATRVAIYLPNSIEFLTTLFACAFYGITPVLVPYNQPHPHVVEQLAATKSDALVAQAGSLPLDEVRALKSVVWVVEKTSRHVDWTEVPQHVGGKMEVGMWHQIVQDHQQDASTLPNLASNELAGLVSIWLGKNGSQPQIVEFTQKNLVSALSALIHSLSLRQRLTPSDLFLSADAFTTGTYPLLLTLSALFSHASLALTSVASPGVSLSAAMRSVAPTVVVASAETAEALHSETKLGVSGGLKALAHGSMTSVLDAGVMPTAGAGILTTLAAPHRASIGSTPGKLRLLFISERVGAETPPLSSQDLSDLRIFTGARVCYALTAAQVAGAVAQTSVFDYRRSLDRRARNSHFGPPLGSVEVKVVDSGSHRTTDEGAVGEIVVAGPAVAGPPVAEVKLGVVGRFNDDHTLAYV